MFISPDKRFMAWSQVIYNLGEDRRVGMYEVLTGSSMTNNKKKIQYIEPSSVSLNSDAAEGATGHQG